MVVSSLSSRRKSESWLLVLEAAIVNLATVLSGNEQFIHGEWVLPDDSEKELKVPMQGVMCVMKVEDDPKRTWKVSAMRCLIHLRRAIAACHANNVRGMGVSACDIEMKRKGGELSFYWNVKKPAHLVNQQVYKEHGYHNSFQDASMNPFVQAELPNAAANEDELQKFDLDCWKELALALVRNIQPTSYPLDKLPSLSEKLEKLGQSDALSKLPKPLTRIADEKFVTVDEFMVMFYLLAATLPPNHPDAREEFHVFLGQANSGVSSAKSHQTTIPRRVKVDEEKDPSVDEKKYPSVDEKQFPPVDEKKYPSWLMFFEP